MVGINHQASLFAHEKKIPQLCTCFRRKQMTFKRSLLPAVIFIVMFGILASLILIYSRTLIGTILLFATVFSLIGPIAYLSVKGRLDLFEPLVVANCSFFFMFLARPLSDLVVGQTSHLGYSILATFNQALFLAWLGITCFQIGYFSRLSNRFASWFPSSPSFKPNTVILSACLFMVLGTILFAQFIITQGGFEIIPHLLEGRQASNNEIFLMSTGYLYNGIILWGPASLLLYAVAIVCKRTHMFIPFAVTILPLIVFYGARGTRSQLLPLVISVPVFWYLWNQRRPNLKTILLAVFIGLALVGWLREVRNIDSNSHKIIKLEKIISSPIATLGDLITSPDTEMFDSLANELLIVPKTLSYMHGATITDIFIRAIPRPLYPNKPLESNDEIVNALWPQHYSLCRASPSFSLIGVLFADSGFISVILGMYILGTIISAAWNWFKANSTHVMAQILYSMGLPFVIILMRGTIPDTLARMLFYFFPLLLLMLFERLQMRVRKHLAFSQEK